MDTNSSAPPPAALQGEVAELITIGNGYRLTHYFWTAALVVLVYDYLITLGGLYVGKETKYGAASLLDNTGPWLTLCELRLIVLSSLSNVEDMQYRICNLLLDFPNAPDKVRISPEFIALVDNDADDLLSRTSAPHLPGMYAVERGIVGVDILYPHDGRRERPLPLGSRTIHTVFVTARKASPQPVTDADAGLVPLLRSGAGFHLGEPHFLEPAAFSIFPVMVPVFHSIIGCRMLINMQNAVYNTALHETTMTVVPLKFKKQQTSFKTATSGSTRVADEEYEMAHMRRS
ncbi:hypothetical protein NM688_g1686 [Phlebia brevispora]|uniref:Uncharacterized protein n=1 Tax=Phlebia brevispora TaxID=194682 RepID=A0ACC1TB30_9APHY|nr:hypothetical protein NM688_g1686 [Phlebia brevispora]